MNREQSASVRAGGAMLATFIVLAPLLAPSRAMAQSGAGGSWYIGANIPLMFIDDTESVAGGEILEPIDLGYRASTLNEFDTGYKLGGNFGYAFESGLRIEFETYYAAAEVGSLVYSDIAVPAINFTLPNDAEIPISGTAEQTAAVVNVWYDFDTAGQWTPYVGAGFGELRVDFGDVDYDANGLAQAVSDAVTEFNQLPRATLPAGFVPELSPKDTTIAWHVGAGATWELSESTLIQLGYRYQASGDIEFSGANETATANAATEQKTHFLELGVRFRLAPLE